MPLQSASLAWLCFPLPPMSFMSSVVKDGLLTCMCVQPHKSHAMLNVRQKRVLGLCSDNYRSSRLWCVLLKKMVKMASDRDEKL